MKLKIKKLSPNAVIPKQIREGDAGYDLVSTYVEYHSRFVEYGTGLAFEIPSGYVGLIVPRSSITNRELMLKNSIGVIDENFRGPVTFRFWRTNGVNSDIYTVGERIGQLVLVPYVSFEIEEVEELSETNRGTGAYGSSGK